MDCSGEVDDNESWKSNRLNNALWNKDDIVYLQNNAYNHDKVNQHESEYSIQGSNIDKINNLFIYTTRPCLVINNSSFHVNFSSTKLNKFRVTLVKMVKPYQGSEFKFVIQVSYNHKRINDLVVNKQIIELIIQYRYMQRLIRMNLEQYTLLLEGKINSVILEINIPSFMLEKKHCAVPYHKIREAKTAGIVRFSHISSEDNYADILTKPLGPSKFMELVKPLLFCNPPED